MLICCQCRRSLNKVCSCFLRGGGRGLFSASGSEGIFLLGGGELPFPSPSSSSSSSFPFRLSLAKGCKNHQIKKLIFKQLYGKQLAFCSFLIYSGLLIWRLPHPSHTHSPFLPSGLRDFAAPAKAGGRPQVQRKKRLKGGGGGCLVIRSGERRKIGRKCLRTGRLLKKGEVER